MPGYTTCLSPPGALSSQSLATPSHQCRLRYQMGLYRPAGQLHGKAGQERVIATSIPAREERRAPVEALERQGGLFRLDLDTRPVWIDDHDVAAARLPDDGPKLRGGFFRPPDSGALVVENVASHRDLKVAHRFGGGDVFPQRMRSGAG